jgi:molybdopterin molybdotransferase
MDGWALRSAATPGILRVVGESAVGNPYRGPLGQDEAVRVMTGALAPDAADAVLRRAHGTECDGVLVAPHVRSGRDLRPAGDDYPRAAEVLPTGHRLRVHDIGVIATCGWDGAFCERRVRTAVVVSCSALVPPGQVPDGTEAVDATRFVLAAAAAAAGATVVWTRSVQDADDALTEAVRDAVGGGPDAVDLVIATGGPGVGGGDRITPILAGFGAQFVFGGISMQPGCRTALALIGETRVLVVPSAPGGAVIAFHLIGRELLGGGVWTPVVLAAPIRVDGPGDEFVWCRASDTGLAPGSKRDADTFAGLAVGDALAWITPGAAQRPAGTCILASSLP